MAVKAKRRGLDIEMRSFTGKDGRAYLVFKTASGAYHSFVEVEAKEAARQCGAKGEGNTRQMWGAVWNQQ